jgi:hypothetical protein
MSNKGIIYLILFLLGLGNVSISQTNPFEIKNRKETKIFHKATDNKKKESFEKKSSEDQDQIKETNPFEINKKKFELSPESISNHKNIEDKEKQKRVDNVLNDVKENQNDDTSLLLWVFLFALVFIALLTSINRALILKIFKSIWFYNLTNILFKNFASREYFYYLFLFINFVLNLSIFIYLFLNKLFNFSGFRLFFIIFSIIFLIYFFKHLFIYIFELIFPTLKSLITYNFTVLLFNISLGVFLLPLNLFVAFSFDSLAVIILYFSGIIILILYILRLFRGFLITYNYFNNSIVHFFLYLCAFEILPLFVLYKIIVEIL